MNICICIPNNYQALDKDFVLSVLDMQSFFYRWQRHAKRNDALSILIQGGIQLDAMRNDLVDSALKYEQTHILFLDSDMTFPKETIKMMIEDFEDNPEIEAVTGLYTWKQPPYVPHVYRHYDKKTGKFAIAGMFPLDSLFRVEGAGTGILMVKAEVFERTERPWFKIEMEEGVKVSGKKGKAEGKRKWSMGEDLYFCLKAKPLILCDPRIRCLHYKQSSHGIDDYIEFNKLKLKKNQITGTKKQIKEIADKHKKNLA